MKKKLVTLLMVAAIAIGICACKGSNDNERDKKEDTTEDSQGSTTTTEDWNNVPCLYGCPYSRRIKRLNLLKRRVGK